MKPALPTRINPQYAVRAFAGFAVGPVESVLTFWPVLIWAHPLAVHWVWVNGVLHELAQELRAPEFAHDQKGQGV